MVTQEAGKVMWIPADSAELKWTEITAIFIMSKSLQIVKMKCEALYGL